MNKLILVVAVLVLALTVYGCNRAKVAPAATTTEAEAVLVPEAAPAAEKKAEAAPTAAAK